MAEDSPVETPKRKRGRPPKAESEKVTPKRKAEADEGTVPKRGRGRPKGSKNKGSGNKKPVSKGTHKFWQRPKPGNPRKSQRLSDLHKMGRRGRPPKNPPAAKEEAASEESPEDAE